jgi:hypothetical protein
MAVSVENQRRSVQGYILPTVVLPRPDAPLEGGHLAHVAWLSGAVAYAPAATGAVVAADSVYRPLFRGRRR